MSCSAKDTGKRMKIQAMDWEKIFEKHIFDKVLVSKICKEHLKLNSKKTNSPIENSAKDLNRQLIKEYHHITIEHAYEKVLFNIICH